MSFNTQLLPSAKREVADRENGKAWLSYYAGYSRSFVTSAFAALGVTEQHLILDPWSGSGTTGSVAQTMGLQSISVEINPVIAYLAAGQFALNSLENKRLQNIVTVLEHLVVILDRSNEIIVLGESVLSYIQKHFTLTQQISNHGLLQHGELSPDFSLAISIVLLAYKKIAGYQLTKNPSWNSHIGSIVNKKDFCASLQQQIAILVTSFTRVRERPTSRQIVGDARRLLLTSGSVDAVVTSPPYLTRIDYVKATSAETAWLFGLEQVRVARENNMGAPVIRRTSASTRWPTESLIADVISDVENHASYAAKNYYLKTFRQYFDDMALSLAEIHRVLKSGGIALLVVQNSYFKEIEIPLGELYVDLWNRRFGSGEIVARHHSKNSIVHINRRAISSRMQTHLHEDTIALYK